MTTTTIPTHHDLERAGQVALDLVCKMRQDRIDEFDIDALRSDTGLHVDGCYAWLVDVGRTEQIIVWLGNDIDFDQRYLTMRDVWA